MIEEPFFCKCGNFHDLGGFDYHPFYHIGDRADFFGIGLLTIASYQLGI